MGSDPPLSVQRPGRYASRCDGPNPEHTSCSGPGFSPGIPGSSTRQTQIRQWNERLLDPGDSGGSVTDRWVPILGDSCARPSVPCRHLSESCTWEVIMRSLITVFTAMLVATGTATAQDASRWEICDAWRGGPVALCERDIHAYISEFTVFERHWHVDETPNGGAALVNKFNPGISYLDMYTYEAEWHGILACYLGTERIGRTGRGNTPPRERLFYHGGSVHGTKYLTSFVGFVEYSIDEGIFENHQAFAINHFPDTEEYPYQCGITVTECYSDPSSVECLTGHGFWQQNIAEDYGTQRTGRID